MAPAVARPARWARRVKAMDAANAAAAAAARPAARIQWSSMRRVAFTSVMRMGPRTRTAAARARRAATAAAEIRRRELMRGIYPHVVSSDVRAEPARLIDDG